MQNNFKQTNKQKSVCKLIYDIWHTKMIQNKLINHSISQDLSSCKALIIQSSNPKFIETDWGSTFVRFVIATDKNRL